MACDRYWKDTWVGNVSLFNGIHMTFFEMTQIKDVDVTRWVQDG